jgi:hypothetical protein
MFVLDEPIVLVKRTRHPCSHGINPRNLYHKGSFRPGKILINRELTRIIVSRSRLFASIRG